MKKLFVMKTAFIAVLLLLSANVRSQEWQAEVVAESPYQWTGIALSAKNRMFVNFPTWQVKSPFKVAEMVNGIPVAFPSEEAQALFTCVQSVVVDSRDRLWILDPATPQLKKVVETGAKLFEVDLATNRIVHTYTFPTEVSGPDSYLNDLRVDCDKNTAYITDSKQGGIVVLNLKTGKAYRALDETVPAVRANLPAIRFKSTGSSRGITHSDGIELSANGKWLYFTALTGNVLYTIPTRVLRNKHLSVMQRATHIKVENLHNVPTDGLTRIGNLLIMADLPKETVWVYNLKTKQGTDIDLGTDIRWADSFATDRHGNVFFTTSQINYPEAQRVNYKIYRMWR